MFGRSFNDIGNAITNKLIDFNDEFERTGKIASSWKSTDSIWKRLYGNKNEFDWIKNSAGDIITNDNIDSLIPQIGLDSAKNKVADIVDWNNEIKAGNKSWQDYFGTLGQGEQYIVDVVKNTDNLTKLTGDDLVKANQNARQAAIAHNAALKQQTLGAKAANLGMKALSTAANAVFSMGIMLLISKGIELISDWANAAENAKEAAEGFRASMAKLNENTATNQSSLSDLNAKYQNLSKGVGELGQNVSLTASEYDEYKDIVAQVSDIMPGLSTQFNDQGEKIGFTKGQLEDLNKEYDKYLQNQARELLYKGNEEGQTFQDILDDFYNVTNVDYGVSWTSTWNELQEIFTLGYLDNFDDIYNAKEKLDIITSIRDAGSKGETLNVLSRHIGINLNDMLNEGLSAFKTYGIPETKEEWDVFTRISERYFNTHIMDDDEQKRILGATYDEIAAFDDEEFENWRNNLNGYIEAYDSEVDMVYNSIRDGLVTMAQADDDWINATDEQRSAVNSFLSNMTEGMIESFEGEDGKLSQAKMFNFVSDLIDKFSNDGELFDAFDSIMSEKFKDMPYDEAVLALNEWLNKIAVATGTQVVDLVDLFKLEESGFKFDSNKKQVNNSLLIGRVKNKTMASLPRGAYSSESSKKIKEIEDNIGTLSFEDLEIASELEIPDGTLLTWEELIEKINKTKETTYEAASSLDDYISASEDIGAIQSAFKELSDDGYISLDAISKIKEAVGGSLSNWDEYEKKLINAKAGSAEFSEVLSELTYAALENKMGLNELAFADEAYIARILEENGVLYANKAAHDIVAKAKVKQKLSTLNLTTATEEQIDKTFAEIEAMGLVGLAVGDLKTAYVDAQENMTKILKDGVLTRLKLSKSELEGIESVADAYKLIGESRENRNNAMTAMNSGYNGQQHLLGLSPLQTTGDPTTWSLSEDEQAIIDQANLQEKINSIMNEFDTKISMVSGSSSSSSAKNEALERELEAVEKRYKVHQDELKYIAELENAYKQYAKTAEERAEIEEKIEEARKAYAENRVKDLEHEIELLQNVKGESANVAEYYKQIQTIANEEANRLRAIGYAENSDEIQEWQKTWWDAHNSIKEGLEAEIDTIEDYIDARDSYNDWKEWGDSEVKAISRQIDIVKQLYREGYYTLDEYNKKIQEFERDIYEVMKDDLIEDLEFDSSQLDSLKTLLQSYYDVTNSIAEAQHEINKELETSKTMYEYLNEDTRKWLFNQEDYNTLNEKLADIQSEADRLQERYNKDILGASKENIEEITSQYQMQYETLMKSYEIAKADLEVAKKKQHLNNVLKERNVRMFIDGQWQWVANTEDVINAQNELADAEYSKTQAETSLAQTEAMNEVQRAQDILTTTINGVENGIVDFDRQVGEITDILSVISDVDVPALGKVCADIGETLKDWVEDLTERQIDTPISYSADFDYSAAMAEFDPNSSAWKHLNKQRNAKIDALGLSYSKYATGTRYTSAGNALMGEVEPEMFITNNGHLIPINQPTFGKIGAGGIVFNQDQLKNLRSLWDLSNVGMVNSNMPIFKERTQTIDNSNCNNVIINGMTVDSGSSDGQALISALRRYVGNH